MESLYSTETTGKGEELCSTPERPQSSKFKFSHPHANIQPVPFNLPMPGAPNKRRRIATDEFESDSNSEPECPWFKRPQCVSPVTQRVARMAAKRRRFLHPPVPFNTAARRASSVSNNRFVVGLVSLCICAASKNEKSNWVCRAEACGTMTAGSSYCRRCLVNRPRPFQGAVCTRHD